MANYVWIPTSLASSIAPTLTLFNSFVRKIPEYYCAVWSPFGNCDCCALEAMQRKITQSFFLKKDFPRANYPSCCGIFLDISSLLKLRNCPMDCLSPFHVVPTFLTPFTEPGSFFHPPIQKCCRPITPHILSPFTLSPSFLLLRTICDYTIHFSVYCLLNK